MQSKVTKFITQLGYELPVPNWMAAVMGLPLNFVGELPSQITVF